MTESARGKIVALMASFFFISLLPGCGQGSNTGPAEIHWDRQTCERCQMVISEQRHAVQVRRLGDPKTHAFDDLGCALVWLDELGLLAGSDRGPEVWVKEGLASDWIDARTARFGEGFSTPMAYGFGATDQGIAIGEVQERVRERENRRRSGSLHDTRLHDHEKDRAVD